MNPYAMKKTEIVSVLSLVPPGSLDKIREYIETFLVLTDFVVAEIVT